MGSKREEALMTTRTQYLSQTVEHLFAELLGDHWDNLPVEHKMDTPRRWINMMEELTTPKPIKFTTFPNEVEQSEMVVMGPIRYSSLCAHHIIPFFGDAWVAYIPDKKLAGLSKLARVVKEQSKGLWTQEELTYAITEFFVENLDPLGVAVVMRGEHLCMSLRGVKEPGATTTTSSLRGVFLKPSPGANPREEFFNAINR